MEKTCETCKHWNGRPILNQHQTFEGYAPCSILGGYGKSLMSGTWQGDGGVVSTQANFGCNLWDSLDER